MVVTCTSCSAKLAIPDEKVPKGVASFLIPCPKCQTKFQVSIKQEGGEGSPAGVSSSTAPPPSPPDGAPASAVEEAASPPPADDDFVENRRLALLCIDQPQYQAAAKTVLVGLGYTVHVPAKPADAADRLRQNRYNLVIVHEEYGGSIETNVVLQTIQPMVMPLRRHICVGLVGKQFRTFDHMMAFTKSVSFVIAERELGKLKAIVQQAVVENDQFYRVFRESLHEAGKQ